jgi:hypothetical protein
MSQFSFTQPGEGFNHFDALGMLPEFAPSAMVFASPKEIIASLAWATNYFGEVKTLPKTKPLCLSHTYLATEKASR